MREGLLGKTMKMLGFVGAAAVISAVPQAGVAQSSDELDAPVVRHEIIEDWAVYSQGDADRRACWAATRAFLGEAVPTTETPIDLDEQGNTADGAGAAANGATQPPDSEASEPIPEVLDGVLLMVSAARQVSVSGVPPGLEMDFVFGDGRQRMFGRDEWAWLVGDIDAAVIQSMARGGQSRLESGGTSLAVFSLSGFRRAFDAARTECDK